MIKKIVAIDFDDVLNSLVESWIGCYNKLFNDNVSPDDIKSWNITSYVKPEYEKEFYNLIINPETNRIIFGESIPQEGSQEITKWLFTDDSYDPYIVTATHYMNIVPKMEWLVKNYPHIPLTKVNIMSNKSLFNADVIIDDRADTVLQFPRHGILYSKPWNNNIEVDHMINVVHNKVRVKKWTDIGSYLELIKFTDF